MSQPAANRGVRDEGVRDEGFREGPDLRRGDAGLQAPAGKAVGEVRHGMAVPGSARGAAAGPGGKRKESAPGPTALSVQEKAFWEKVSQHLGDRQFNDEQVKAIRAPDGPVLIEAGPGSGKTTVLTWRIVYLLSVRGVQADKIAVVTFTNAAADELKERIARIVGNGRGDAIQASTIHSMALRLLRAHDARWTNWSIVTDQAHRKMAQLVREFGVLDANDDTAANVLTEISRARNLMMRPEEYTPETVDQHDFVKMAAAYRDWKRQGQLLDFDDMLVLLYTLLCRHPQAFQGRFSHLLVDEFQDTSPLQYAIIKMLAAPRNNVMVVGDIDQAIYSWRGAGPDVMLQFPKDYPKARRLSLRLNYRARERLVDVTNRLIARNRRRFASSVRWVKPGGTDPKVLGSADDAEEARAIAQVLKQGHEEGIPWGEMAVIYRMNYQALPFIAHLGREGIPFRILGEPANPFRHWVGQDVLSYLRLALGEKNPALLERIMYRPNRYISRSATEAAGRVFRHGGSVAEAFARAGVGLTMSQEEEVAKLDEHLRELLRQRSASEAVRFVRDVINYGAYVKSRTEGSARQSVEAEAVLALLELLAESWPALDVFVEKGTALAEAAKGWWKTVTAPLGGGLQLSEADADAVTLTTCHSAKGLEFDLVAVAGLVEGVLPAKDGDMEEERRLCYVAMTRAREALFLSVPQHLLGAKRVPSRFVKEALPDVPEAEGPARREPAPSLALEVGDRVRHTAFGEGVVAGFSPSGESVQVDFPSVGRKTLLVSFCAENRLLTRLE